MPGFGFTSLDGGNPNGLATGIDAGSTPTRSGSRTKRASTGTRRIRTGHLGHHREVALNGGDALFQVR